MTVTGPNVDAIAFRTPRRAPGTQPEDACQEIEPPESDGRRAGALLGESSDFGPPRLERVARLIFASADGFDFGLVRANVSSVQLSLSPATAVEAENAAAAIKTQAIAERLNLRSAMAARGS